jgi:dTDP-3-amino-2,3,6-trideoxy-4-keto-D-glucose/dTDP-3-amino-3,4,6-trideoxy-alpha-D-glucose/dTDP-2,6-dideoxy-D-kanosamine transaminase
MEMQHNYLPQQYQNTGKQDINHNYLKKQFSDYKDIFDKIEKLIQNCDYTLGEEVDKFEKNICELVGSSYAIGVGSGTDALFLSLKAIGIKDGDEVITTPYTFFATIGAIVTAGAKPVFVDVGNDFNIDPNLIEQAITEKTKAILPVHWAGLSCDMDKIMEIANKNNLQVVEDACHAINARYKGKRPGTFGITGCFSMHPLKNLNVWGDGGFIVTDSKEMHDKLVLIRNHGLINRNQCAEFSYNSRLDTLQAIVANHLLPKVDHITDSRIQNAIYYDKELSKINGIKVPIRDSQIKQVFHIYVIQAKDRDELVEFLNENKIDAKIHYPIPMHLQPAAEKYGYKKGDFPKAENICNSVLSLPVHEFISEEEQKLVVLKISEFYIKKKSKNEHNGYFHLKNRNSNINNSNINNFKVPFVNLGIHYKNLKDEIIQKFDDISSQGSYVLTNELNEFEKNFANFCGTKYAIGVANGTDALILSMKAIGIKEGDEVITAPNSFIASAGAIAAVGATPVFVDVNEDYNINPDLIENAITEKTKAIMPIHLTGRPAEMNKIIEIANSHNLKIIEDAAQAIGAEYKGKKVGSFGISGCFSLHPLKNLHVQGDGGIITTNNTEFFEKIIKLRNHGLKNRDECEFWGYNSRLDSIQAGIGNIKLKKIDDWNNRYREIASIYREGLKEINNHLIVPKDKDYENPVYHNFVIETQRRDELVQHLLNNGIETKVHYPIPLHLQEAASSLGYFKGDFPVCELQTTKILSLPIYPELTNEQIELVIKNIKSFFE